MAENNKLPSTEGYFIGSELINTGTTKEGKEWKLYKAKFKPNMDTDKSFSFSVFPPLTAKNTKQLKELEPGQEYRILYAEKEFTTKDGNAATGKTAIGFYTPNSNGNTAQNTQKSTLKPDLSTFEAFKVNYMETIKKADIKPNVVHMVGSFLATKEGDRIKELIQKCKGVIQKCQEKTDLMK